MLDTVYGQTKKQRQAKILAQMIGQLGLDGTLYIGYPVIASAEEAISVDAMLVTERHGLIAFVLRDDTPSSEADWENVKSEQDRLHFAIRTNLGRHESLRDGRELGLELNVVTVFPILKTKPKQKEIAVSDVAGVEEVILGCKPVPQRYWRSLNAALQRITTIKPPKRRADVSKAQSRGAIMKKIDQEIANLDQWQKRAAIDSPDGPQRIRGLAGSGKTIVLALKAAYLHAQHQDWNIALTFHTRSLYQQFGNLIRRFSFEHLGDEPNWEKLRVIHAWGSSDSKGLYSEMAEKAGAISRSFMYGRAKYGMRNAFTGICSELLAIVSQKAPEPIYDAVLVDEAQDLPPAFFRLVYLFTKPPKRIVWAYDELQNLSETTMPSVDDLFGKDDLGIPLVRLSNPPDGPKQDVILPVCYRNTPWALTLGHSLGFGIYRPEGLVQHFDDPGLWREIGYQVVDGTLSPGSQATLERGRDSFPPYFSELLKPDDAIQFREFATELEQIEWLSDRIASNLKKDELEADDILVVLPDTFTAKSKASVIIESLARRGIKSHLAGVTTSRDQIFLSDSIAIANIHRSKGNEAPLVYILNAQYCVAGHELITLRNILFTAITRSKAWIEICGVGPDMTRLIQEIKNVQESSYLLRFKVPTRDELAKLRMIHRDRTADERARLLKMEDSLREFLDSVERGDIALENLPPNIRTAMSKYFGTAGPTDDDT